MTTKKKASASSRKLNLGCGHDSKAGWVNLDIAPLPGVDVVHDIEKTPLPFGNESFDEILCNDILEHIDYPKVLKDLHRVLIPGGIVHIRVPHFTSKNNAIDPTHKRIFSIETFDFFCHGVTEGNKAGRYMYPDFVFNVATAPSITFEHSRTFFWYNKIIEWWVNTSRKRQQLYESTGLSCLFPAQNILITLKKSFI